MKTIESQEVVRDTSVSEVSGEWGEGPKYGYKVLDADGDTVSEGSGAATLMVVGLREMPPEEGDDENGRRSEVIGTFSGRPEHGPDLFADLMLQYAQMLDVPVDLVLIAILEEIQNRVRFQERQQAAQAAASALGG